MSQNNQIPSNAIVRMFFVVLFNLINWFVGKIIILLAVYQFISHLLTGRVAECTIRWGEAMSNWTWQMMLFMTYKTERMPFPFHIMNSDSNRE